MVVDCGKNFVYYEDGLKIFDNGKGGAKAAATKKDMKLEECANECRKTKLCTSFAYPENRKKRKKPCWMWIQEESQKGNPYSWKKPGDIHCQKGNKHNSFL